MSGTKRTKMQIVFIFFAQQSWFTRPDRDSTGALTSNISPVIVTARARKDKKFHARAALVPSALRTKN